MKLHERVKTGYRHKLFGESNTYIDPGHTGTIVGVIKGGVLVRWDHRSGFHKYGTGSILLTPVNPSPVTERNVARVPTMRFLFATGGLVGHNGRG